jgi:hypothetical protein
MLDSWQGKEIYHLSRKVQSSSAVQLQIQLESGAVLPAARGWNMDLTIQPYLANFRFFFVAQQPKSSLVRLIVEPPDRTAHLHARTHTHTNTQPVGLS